MPSSVDGMTSLSDRPVARLSSPGAIVATLPSLCGFPPEDSLVVLSLRGERRRVGLTARLDLPPPSQETAAAEMLAERMRLDGAREAVVVVLSPQRRPSLVEAVGDALATRAIDVHEALHVADGRWWSYECSSSCCPAEGTPVPPPPTLVEAQRALTGKAVLASRAELVASLAGPTFLAAEQAGQTLDDAAERWVAHWAADPEGACVAAVQRTRRLLDAVGPGAPVDLAEAAALTIALHDHRVRDEIATWALRRSDALLSLLEQTARQVVPPFDAPVCTLLAWVAYARGDGSRVNVALDRALGTDPEYPLANLLLTALEGGVAPREVRQLLKSTKRMLRLSSPG